MKIHTPTLSYDESYDRYIFYGFVTVLISLGILYGILLNQTVQNVVERKALSENIAHISSGVSELEHAYLSLKQDITLDYALSLGFKEQQKVTYVDRGGESRALTFLDIDSESGGE